MRSNQTECINDYNVCHTEQQTGCLDTYMACRKSESNGYGFFGIVIAFVLAYVVLGKS